MYHVVVKGHDRFIQSREFTQPLPLYAWSQAEHGAELDRLLHGDEVSYTFSIHLQS